MRRSESYEKVWLIPITKLAVEFGISDVGLAVGAGFGDFWEPASGH